MGGFKHIYDQPDHPHYGPVRRLHLILLYLFGDRLAEAEQEFRAGCGLDWTSALVSLIEQRCPESQAARTILNDLGV